MNHAPKPPSEEERFWRFALHETGCQPELARSFIKRYGLAKKAIFEGTSSEWKVLGKDRDEYLRTLETLYSDASRKGWKFYVEEEFCEALSGLAKSDMPFGMWSHGNFDWISSRGVHIAVVGTRRPTAYGQRVCEDLTRGLAQLGAVIVSGLAYGIDVFAHKEALKAGSNTVAVLGTGLNHAYPLAHERLQSHLIPNSGAVLSEFPLNMQGFKHHFPLRNRLIAALSRAVLVVEGDGQSGALITAKFALDQGKDVLAVPGNIYSVMSRAPNRLIQSGAAAVTSLEDFFEYFPLIKEAAARTLLKAGTSNGANLPSYSDTHKKILDHLGSEPLILDSIQELTQLDLIPLSTALQELEIAGAIREQPPYGYIKRGSCSD